MSPPEMSRQLKRLIVKFEQKPPEGYANMNTAVGVSKKTFQWLEQLDVAADKLATFVQVFLSFYVLLHISCAKEESATLTVCIERSYCFIYSDMLSAT